MMTTESIMIAYALEKREFTQDQMQREIPLFGKVRCGKLHNPDSYNRIWRHIRSKGGIPGYNIESGYKGVQKWFKLTKKDT